ncbi:MAG: tRNA(Met) cytidine acetyltransferase, partial [Deltaproteobacteria bacterium]
MRRRHLIALRGSREETAAAALAALARRPAGGDDLWVGPDHTPGRAVRKLLGRAYDAVVLDLHDGLDADVLGQAHGFVRAGGALILRLPPHDGPPGPLPLDARLAAHPFTAADVGDRFRLHFERALARAERSPAGALGPVDHAVTGSPDQAAAVAELTERLRVPTPSLTTLVADRGRGKSSALGLALRGLADAALRVIVTAEDPGSAAEVFRFATGAPEPPTDGALRFVPPMALATGDDPADVIVVDEAAQLPVPVLQQLVRRHPEARVAFATTARGYEGTGRGFMLRFLAWLETDPRPRRHLTLETPIRWAPDDPVERFVFDALLLDARPAPVAADADGRPCDVDHALLDRDGLVRDERDLADVFGLLVHAHYRTTPEDLHRILDAPNLALHALRTRDSGRVVAVNLVATEGALPPALREDVARGRHRLRAHALADALVAHCGQTEAGALTMLRSVRIATHPDLRRRRLASTLIRAVERASEVDLFGTVFGATAELLAFRRSLGYELVRVSASRGARTGEPAALMLRPRSAAAHALLAHLRADLARDLPHQLALLEADGELLLDPDLASALGHGLPPVAPLDEAARDAAVAAYLGSPRTFESAASAVTSFVHAHLGALDALADPRQAALLR